MISFTKRLKSGKAKMNNYDMLAKCVKDFFLYKITSYFIGKM